MAEAPKEDRGKDQLDEKPPTKSGPPAAAAGMTTRGLSKKARKLVKETALYKELNAIMPNSPEVEKQKKRMHKTEEAVRKENGQPSIIYGGAPTISAILSPSQKGKSRSTEAGSSSSPTRSAKKHGGKRAKKHKYPSKKERAHLKVSIPPAKARVSAQAFSYWLYTLSNIRIRPDTKEKHLPKEHLGSVWTGEQDLAWEFQKPLVARYHSLGEWPRIILFIVARIEWFNNLVDNTYANYSAKRLRKFWHGHGEAAHNDMILIEQARVAKPALAPSPDPNSSAAPPTASATPKGAPAHSGPTSKYFCTYCDKSGHSLEYCNAHSKAQAWAAKSRDTPKPEEKKP